MKDMRECWSSVETLVYCCYWYTSCQQSQLKCGMISGTAKNRKCYPVHEASHRLTQSVKTNLLSFHALTGCDTTSAFHSYWKKSCWKTFRNQPLPVAGIGRDGELAPIEQFVCHLYGRPEQSSVDQARLHVFFEAKKCVVVPEPQGCVMRLVF